MVVVGVDIIFILAEGFVKNIKILIMCGSKRECFLGLGLLIRQWTCTIASTVIGIDIQLLQIMQHPVDRLMKY